MVRAGESEKPWRELYAKVTYPALRQWLDRRIAAI
jgi:hypothetical protein